MTAPDGFNIHDPVWWAQEDADILARLQEFYQVDPENVSPEVAFRVGAVALAEFVNLYEVVKALALESHAKRVHTPKRPTSTKNGDA
jgi:hypothetical protein